jgi:hypothetical protein
VINQVYLPTTGEKKAWHQVVLFSWVSLYISLDTLDFDFWFRHPIPFLGEKQEKQNTFGIILKEKKEKKKRKPKSLSYFQFIPQHPHHLEIVGLLLIFTLGGGAPSSAPAADPYAP